LEWLAQLIEDRQLPETVIAWNRKGFRLYWAWKSRAQLGRPTATHEIRTLIRKMSLSNPRWGAPRIHGELLKLGIDIGETTVSKYMVRPRRPSSQTWKTFLKNHMHNLVSTDFFIVPTATFRLLFVFLVLSHERRRVVHFAVTAHPTTEWSAQQLISAFPWNTDTRYLLRDRDGSYGGRFSESVEAIGIKEILTAPRSPWQNAYVERMIGSIRRDCLDHVLIFNERGLRRILRLYFRLLREIANSLRSAERCSDSSPSPTAISREGDCNSSSGRVAPSLRTLGCITNSGRNVCE
jgi:transposase InsO family protein